MTPEQRRLYKRAYIARFPERYKAYVEADAMGLRGRDTAAYVRARVAELKAITDEPRTLAPDDPRMHGCTRSLCPLARCCRRFRTAMSLLLKGIKPRTVPAKCRNNPLPCIFFWERGK